ncbi:C40 family peptidase [Domibacillus indicus]|uniref:C40 family peptidase n=1 Tax=Domibacillus indicus TaxID=1437523 RepID=UPI0009E5B914|nr:C40 family peptidase [Domibacillus indicus]
MNSCKKAIFSFLAIILFLSMSPLTAVKTEAASIGESVVAYGKKFIGVPYVWGGTTPGGFDCSGFVQYIYKNVADVSLPRTTGEQYAVGTAVAKSELQVGDLIFYANTYKKGISHVGIYAGNNQVLNATSSKGIALVSMNDSYWGPKYAGAKRVLAGPASSIAAPDWFTDVPAASITYQAIKTLTESNIINGYNDYTFRPDEQVTRGQAAAILNRVLGLQAQASSSFTDVPAGNAFAADIAAIQEAGIINGFDDQTFRPYNNMTRNEMAIIIHRAFELELPAAAAGPIYSDVNSSHWAYAGILTVASTDKIGFFQNEKFDGSKTATREAFTAAIFNAMNAN